MEEIIAKITQKILNEINKNISSPTQKEVGECVAMELSKYFNNDIKEKSENDNSILNNNTNIPATPTTHHNENSIFNNDFQNNTNNIGNDISNLFDINDENNNDISNSDGLKNLSQLSFDNNPRIWLFPFVFDDIVNILNVQNLWNNF